MFNGAHPKTNEHLPTREEDLAAKRKADLEWRINFAEMKLTDWRQVSNIQKVHLIRLQRHAQRELKSLFS